MGKPKRATIQAAAEASITPPDVLLPTQALARVVRAEGNRLFSVQLPDKTTVSAEMPDRFRSTLWIRRGGYVLVELRPNDQTAASGDQPKDRPSATSGGRRVGGEIVNVVRDEKEWRKQPYW